MMALKILCAAPMSLGTLLLGSMTLAPTSSPMGALPMAATAEVIGPLDMGERPVAGPIQPNRYHRAKDGLFYVTALVNGAAIRFLLDTGANMVVLTEDDARRAGLSPGDGENSATMETAAGLSKIDRVTLDRVMVAGHEVRDVDAAVATRGLKVSLLGQDLLSRLGAITISGNSVTLHAAAGHPGERASTGQPDL